LKRLKETLNHLQPGKGETGRCRKTERRKGETLREENPPRGGRSDGVGVRSSGKHSVSPHVLGENLREKEKALRGLREVSKRC